MNGTDYENFKLILQRFVAYLKFANALSLSEISGAKIEDKFVNFCKNQESNTKLKQLYSDLCKLFKLKDKIDITQRFGWGGQGYNDGPIFNLIKDISVFNEGQISISIYSPHAFVNDACYLHWLILGSDVSIYPIWKGKRDDKDNDIISLKVCLSKDKDKTSNEDNTIIVGKFDNKEKLEEFYQRFVILKKDSLTLLLKQAKNIIFTGAPGTGKTYLAKQIAELIGAETEFVQFHPSYDYTDFVEGLRPKEVNENIVFERKDGIFKAFCEIALKKYLVSKDIQETDLEKFIQKNASNKVNNELNSIRKQIQNIFPNSNDTNATSAPQNFVFIVDEINRGEISKIFGELFFSVDPGYRGVSGAVKTQYANLQIAPNLFDLVLLALGKIDDGDWGHFFIPENVYIIGTMNDIDRSVESMDFAFRRRFTFKEIQAEDTQLQILNSMKIDDLKLKEKAIKKLIDKMDELNKAIYDPKNTSNDNQVDLSEAYHIGAAYFKHYTDYINQDDPFGKLWENHLRGVLFEYLRGKPNAKDILEQWHNAYDNGLLYMVNLKAEALKTALLEAQVENTDERIAQIESIIRENPNVKTKKNLQNLIEQADQFKDIIKIIKECWVTKKNNTNTEAAEDE